MAQRQISLAIDGDVDLATYVDILTRFQVLLDAIAEDVAPGVPIRWRVVQEQPPPAAAPLEQVTVLVPGLRTVGENHRYAHLGVRMRRARDERALMYYTLSERLGRSWSQDHRLQSVRVTLTRIAPRRMDAADGLPSALKHCKDGVADYLCGTRGDGHRHDDDPRFTWRYAQRRGKPKEYAVEITLEALL